MAIINTVMAFVIATGVFGIGLSIYALWIFVIRKRIGE